MTDKQQLAQNLGALRELLFESHMHPTPSQMIMNWTPITTNSPAAVGRSSVRVLPLLYFRIQYAIIREHVLWPLITVVPLTASLPAYSHTLAAPPASLLAPFKMQTAAASERAQTLSKCASRHVTSNLLYFCCSYSLSSREHCQVP